MDNIYILYDDTGRFKGFYPDLSVVNNIIEKSEATLKYNKISTELRDYLTLSKIDLGYPVIDISKVTSDTIIDNMDYIVAQEIQPKIISLNEKKSDLILNIKSECSNYICNGLAIADSEGNMLQYSYKIEDQINLKNFVDNYSFGDSLLYHAVGQECKLYSYSDIVEIYKRLENNKNYNLIYTQVVCKWIINNYTDNLSVIPYGYCNDEILEEVERIYESQILK